MLPIGKTAQGLIALELFPFRRIGIKREEAAAVLSALWVAEDARNATGIMLRHDGVVRVEMVIPVGPYDFDAAQKRLEQVAINAVAAMADRTSSGELAQAISKAIREG